MNINASFQIAQLGPFVMPLLCTFVETCSVLVRTLGVMYHARLASYQQRAVFADSLFDVVRLGKTPDD